MTAHSDAVLAIVAKHAHIDASRISMTTPLDELSIDSLGMVEIIFEIEEHFNVALPEDARIAERFAGFKTPADIVAAIDTLATSGQ